MKQFFFDCQLFCLIGSIELGLVCEPYLLELKQDPLLILRAHDRVAKRTDPGNLYFDNVSG